VTITNKISANQAVTALTFDGAAGDVIYTIRDSASSIAAVLAGASAAAVTGATSIEVSTAASIASAARLSEVSKISYTISDTAANIQSALNTANGIAASDRASVLGATSVTVTGTASVDQALGVASTETRGLYTVSNISYAIKDTGANIAAGLRGIDAAGIINASTVALDAANYVMSVSDADLIFATLGAKFIKADHDADALTASIYSITDTVAKIESADAAMIDGASVVTAQGTTGNNVIDLSAFGRKLAIEGLAGDDTIFGTSFADTLTGGTGVDVMTGGDGADVFVVAAADTGIIVATADTITDFTTTVDKLSLGAAGSAGNFLAVGTAVADFAAALVAADAAFAADAGGAKTYYVANDGTNTYVFIDQGGNGVAAEDVIILTGVVTVASTDIIA
jgi:Ca2+-binding RTX toxin-like protein